MSEALNIALAIWAFIVLLGLAVMSQSHTIALWLGAKHALDMAENLARARRAQAAAIEAHLLKLAKEGA